MIKRFFAALISLMVVYAVPASAGISKSYDVQIQSLQTGGANDATARTALTGSANDSTARTALTGSANDSTARGSIAPVGAIIVHAGTACPAGWLIIPTAATNISRSTYAALFAAIGTTWGAGDGSTTFGMPFILADQVPLQASGNVAAQTVGQVISHTHTGTGISAGTGLASGTAWAATGATGSTGGSYNLAAGTRFIHCIKY